MSKRKWQRLRKMHKISAKHGGVCWYCGLKLIYRLPREHRMYPTIEHLVAKSRCKEAEHFNPNKASNLVVVHAVCNKELSTLSLKEKLAARLKQLVRNVI